MKDINKVIKIFKDFNQHTDDYLGAMFINIFEKLPHCYRIYFDEHKKLTYNSTLDSFEDINKKIKYKISLRKFLYNVSKKEHVEVFCYSYSEYLILYEDNDCCFLMNATMSDREDSSEHYEEIYTTNIERSFNIIKDCFEIAVKPAKIEFGIAAIDVSNSVYTSWYDYNSKKIDIKKNYNDDIPYKKMCEIIENEKSALMLFYGDPGTGKSSLIKHFISEYNDKDFIFMDGDLLVNASKEKLMAYFLDNQNTVFILEDCEKALMSRNHSNNPIMSVLLNLTDGIIGDVLGIKLICTFNTSLNNIDAALLRKGRLSLKYEFKKLCKEKCRKLLKDDSINEDMTLADLYNKNDENDFSKKPSRKIGF